MSMMTSLSLPLTLPPSLSLRVRPTGNIIMFSDYIIRSTHLSFPALLGWYSSVCSSFSISTTHFVPRSISEMRHKENHKTDFNYDIPECQFQEFLDLHSIHSPLRLKGRTLTATFTLSVVVILNMI